MPWLKALAESDHDAPVRSAALHEVAGGWKDDPETVPWLKALAESDQDASVRSAAVQELTPRRDDYEDDYDYLDPW